MSQRVEAEIIKHNPDEDADVPHDPAEEVRPRCSSQGQVSKDVAVVVQCYLTEQHPGDHRGWHPSCGDFSWVDRGMD